MRCSGKARSMYGTTSMWRIGVLGNWLLNLRNTTDSQEFP